MLVDNLGTPELNIIALVMAVGGPIAIVVLVVFLIKRSKNSDAHLKKCAFCAYSIPMEAIVCRFCGRELGR